MLTIDLINLLDVFEPGGDSSVHGEVLAGDGTGNRHAVEDLHEEVVDFHVEALQDLVAEGESFRHVSRLVVSSEQNDIGREVHFERKEQDADFDALDASVHVVAKEEIVQTAGLSRLGDHVEQIRVLAMDISNHTNRLLNLHEICFRLEELQS